MHEPRPPLYAQLAHNVAESYSPEEEGGTEESALEPRLIPPVRLNIPYRHPFHRAIRLLGLAILLGSSLGVLGAAAGMRINVIGVAAALILSLLLIGFSARPSLRRPRF